MTANGVGCACVILLVIAAFAPNNSPKVLSLQEVSVARVVREKSAKPFDCSDTNDYSFVVIENPKRRKDSDPVVPKDLNIVVDEEVRSKIELPKESEAKNFSLNSTESNKAGFEIKVDWGGGLDHYEIQFNFRCEEKNFYLYKVKKTSLFTRRPESGKFLDQKKSKVTKIEPNLPIEKFVMTNYL